MTRHFAFKIHVMAQIKSLILSVDVQYAKSTQNPHLMELDANLVFAGLGKSSSEMEHVKIVQNSLQYQKMARIAIKLFVVTTKKSPWMVNAWTAQLTLWQVTIKNNV